MMMLSDLAAPFPKGSVHWRIQGTPYERNGEFFGMALAYIDARDVMDRLDEVCGPENWQSDFVETPSGRVMCRLGIFSEGQWIWKSDGAGGTAVEAEKGGISDALKRAAVQWGVGRYLYRLDAPWVKCEVREKGGKVYWKKWLEDPWSKVKPPPEPKPTFDSRACADRILAAVERRDTEEDLSALWESEKDSLKLLTDPHYAEVKAAFGRRKSAIASTHADLDEHAYQ